MKSLVDLIIEDAVKQSEIYFDTEEEENVGEIISSKKKEMLIDEIYWLMETCVDNCEDIDDEVEFFQSYKEELTKFITQHISDNLSEKTFDICVNKAMKKASEELWLDRTQTRLVGRFARFLKQM